MVEAVVATAESKFNEKTWISKKNLPYLFQMCKALLLNFRRIFGKRHCCNNYYYERQLTDTT